MRHPARRTLFAEIARGARECRGCLCLLGLLCAFMPAQAEAQEPHWHLGARYNILASDAPPANDMHGYGFALRRDAGASWRLGLAVELYEFDYEEPYKVLALERPPGTEPIDGVNESVVVSAWLERDFARTQRWSGFWSAGIGYAFLTVDRVTGPTATGAQFDIRTDARDELHLLGSLGVRYRLSARWSVEAAILAQHHFTDYELQDAVSGRTGTIGSQTPLGISLGIVAQF